MISVGNLSVGGSGKTPLVASLARWLIERGERPAILSRGYGRRIRDAGVIVVSDAGRVLADLDRAGDEPLMLARDLAGAIVAVSEDRYLAGLLAEHKLGATVHVLDDGFQHVQLARDLDILVTAPGEIAGGRMLPFGRLREPIDAAARAHVVVVMGAGETAARSEAWTLGVSQSCGARRVLGLEACGLAPVFAIAGVGQPFQFFESLREAGLEVRGSRAFPDHHRYTMADAREISETARGAGADMVVTTEKDAIRLEPLGDLPFPYVALPVTLALDPPEALFASVAAALARAREVV